MPKRSVRRGGRGGARGGGQDGKQRAGWLPLHYACSNGSSLENVQFLHQVYGEGITTPTKRGWLPIHIACESATLEVIQFLHYSYPEGVTRKNKEGIKPVDLLRNNPKLSEEDKAAARAILANPPGDYTPPPLRQTARSTPAVNETTTSADESITSTISGTTADSTPSKGSPHSGGNPSSPAISTRPSTSTPPDEDAAEGSATRKKQDALGGNERGLAADAAVAAHARAKANAERLAEKAAAAKEASKQARISAEGLEATEEEAGAAADAARRVWEEASRKLSAAKDAARFGRRKAEVTVWNANRLRQEAHVARGNLESTAVAAGNALARKREAHYKVFLKERDAMKPVSVSEWMKRISPPSVELFANASETSEGRVTDTFDTTGTTN